MESHPTHVRSPQMLVNREHILQTADNGKRQTLVFHQVISLSVPALPQFVRLDRLDPYGIDPYRIGMLQRLSYAANRRPSRWYSGNQDRFHCPAYEGRWP